MLFRVLWRPDGVSGAPFGGGVGIVNDVAGGYDLDTLHGVLFVSRWHFLPPRGRAVYCLQQVLYMFFCVVLLTPVGW